MESHGVLIDCILVEIKETKLTTFDLKGHDALHNNLLQFIEIFWLNVWTILKIEETKK